MKKRVSPWSESAKIELVRRHMSQVELARELGYCRAFVCRALNDEFGPESPVVMKISAYLGIPLPKEEYHNAITISGSQG